MYICNDKSLLLFRYVNMSAYYYITSLILEPAFTLINILSFYIILEVTGPLSSFTPMRKHFGANYAHMTSTEYTHFFFCMFFIHLEICSY